jgi:hypothetical protein
VIEWRLSGPEPAEDHPRTLDQPAEGTTQITISRPEVRNTLRSAHLFERPDAFNVLATL